MSFRNMRLFIIAMFALITILCFCKCSAAKIVAKQDAANSELKKKWAIDWAKENPCDNDTLFLAGASDTLINETVKYDTLYIPPFGSDTVYTPKLIVKTITVTKQITDTIKTNTIDRREVNALKDALTLSQNDLVKQTSLTEIEKASYSKFKWMFWLMFIIALIAIAIIIYSFFSPKHFA